MSALESKPFSTKAPSRSMPPADVAVRLAEALDVSVEYLVGGSRSRPEISSQHRHLVSTFEKLSEKEKQAVELLVQKLTS